MPAGLQIKLPTEELTNLTKEMQVALAQKTNDILDVVGGQFLQLVQEAYIEKGRGGVGSDGIKWEPIQLGTLLARQRRSGRLVDPGDKDAKHVTPAKTKGVGKLHKVKKVAVEDSEAYQQAIDAGALKLIKGSRKKNKKGENVFGAGTIFGVVRDKKTGRTSDSLKKRVTGGYEIGRNTGLQLISLQPGINGTAGKHAEFTPTSVTVGAAMEYSKYFDEHRTIIPEILPLEWMDQLEARAAEMGAEIIETVINNSN